MNKYRIVKHAPNPNDEESKEYYTLELFIEFRLFFLIKYKDWIPMMKDEFVLEFKSEEDALYFLNNNKKVIKEISL